MCPRKGEVGNIAEPYIAMISTRDQHLVQTDYRGVNENDHHWESNAWARFTYYARMPDVDYSDTPNVEPPE
jgi:hypothetical protein